MYIIERDIKKTLSYEGNETEKIIGFCEIRDTEEEVRKRWRQR